MKGLKLLFFFGCFSFISMKANAQTDTEFWFAAPAISASHADKPIVLRLSSYALAATVTITEPANASFQPIVINLNPYSAQTVPLTSFISMIESEPHNIVLNYGLKISATNIISAYYEMQGMSGASYNNPEIFALKGSTSKGLNFMIPGQTQYDNHALATPAHNGFVVVATEDNTLVDITPSKDAYGHTANTKFTISLNKGQSYSVIAASAVGALHLVGSVVTANKPICITVYDDSIGPTSNYDLVGDQIIPEDANGQEFILVRGEMNVGNTGPFDYYNILATTDNTSVYLNGSTTPLQTLNRGGVYTGKLSDPSAYIKTSNPVYVNQLTGIVNEMAFTDLPSIRCTGSSIVSFVRSITQFFYLNLLCKTADIDHFLLNGNANQITGAMFSAVPGTNGEWMYARISQTNFSNINSVIPVDVSTVVSNTTGLFHLGFLNGTTGSAELGYFSNYSRTTLSPVVAGLQCTGNNINLLATNVLGATYQWTGPNGFTSNIYNPSISNVNPTQSGYYVVSANILGCGSFTDSTLITVHPLPTTTITMGDSICLGKSRLLSLNLTGTAPFIFSYSDGVKTDTISGILSSPYVLTVAPITNTTYTLKHITDANSCTVNSSNAVLNIATTVKVNPNPQVNFGLPVQVCYPNGSAAFFDSSKISDASEASFTYRWSFGDGTFESIKNPVHLYATTGMQQVQLQVFSKFGCVDSVTKSIPVYSKPDASFLVDAVYCLRDSMQLKDQSDGKGNTIVKWYWKFANSEIDSVAQPKFVYANAGNKSIQLVVQTDKGCVSDTMVKTTLINPLPTASFTVANTTCEKAAIAFTNTSVANAGALKRWYWNFADGTSLDTSSGGVFNKTYLHFKNYPVQLMVQSDNGCKSDTLLKSISIHAQPQVGFVLPEVCLADAVANFIDTTIIADGAAAVAYNWIYNVPPSAITIGPSIASSTTKNGSTHYNQYGDYQVSLKVTSSFGCDSTLVKAFKVNGSIPHANFVVLNNAQLCSNDSIRIYDASTVDFGTITRNDIYWNYTGIGSADSTDDNTYLSKRYATKYPYFATPATRTIQIKMTAHSGSSSVCADSITKIITLHQSPTVQFTTLPGICNDTTARQIIQASETKNVPGTFVYSGTGVSSTGLFTPTSVLPGTYPIKYVYSTAFSCADSATKSVTVWPSPIAKWGIADPACEKNSVLFSDSSVANYSNIIQRKWNFGDGVTAIKNSTTAFNYTYSSANSYAVGLQVVTDSGCSSLWNQQTIKINSLPRVDFSLPSICLPDGKGLFNNLSTIKDATEALFSYHWNFNDANDPSSATLPNPVHRFTAVGPYTIQLIVRSNNNCVDSISKILTTVYPQPKAKFSSTPSEICLNETIRFNDLSDGITSVVNTWVWDLANGNSASVQNPNKKFTDSGSFQISLSVVNAQGCVSDTARQQITVHPFPILKMGAMKKVLEGGEIILNPQFIYGNQLSYLWTPPSYLSSDTTRNPLVKPLDDITYLLYVTGIGGCTVSDSLFVQLLRAPEVPNAFTPNGDGINDTWRIKYLESYPGAVVDVFNRYGQKVYTSEGYSVEWDGKYNGKNLPVGTYYYIINPKNGRKAISGSVTIIL